MLTQLRLHAEQAYKQLWREIETRLYRHAHRQLNFVYDQGYWVVAEQVFDQIENRIEGQLKDA